jgi:hypothetical protein
MVVTVVAEFVKTMKVVLMGNVHLLQYVVVTEKSAVRQMGAVIDAVL